MNENVTRGKRPPWGDASPRIGLVLGAGGVVGGAFHAGVLAAFAEATCWNPQNAKIIVGTSAGSIAGSSLRAGLSAADMLARAQDLPLSKEGAVLLKETSVAQLPAAELERGRRRTPAEVATLLQHAARRPLSLRPLAIVASLVPDGRMPTEFISSRMSTFVPETWPQESLWICAVRRRDGRRVVFGRDAHPAVPRAVAASCAIPGVFKPVEIDGDPYVDGGAHSPTNADVLADEQLDLVLVSSPMSIASRSLRFKTDQPARRWSRALLELEARRIRSRGIPVMAFQPTLDDLAVMGLRAMDWRRRGPVARQARLSTLRRLARADTQERLGAIF